MSPARRFGLLFARQRLLAGLSQEELQSVLDIHRTEISLIERGGREPRLDTLLQLAAGVETEPAELVTGMRWIPGAYEIGGGYATAADEVEPEREPLDV
ncbi:MAG TPA: helix-turn-helix transcriptional regulator [Solirubrobacterales bacterium]|jgi:transcriptional regulator with XRE-family HTH domain|nr:helix-turn-helix transcriptional regulator [Solirubrobacterales bacterium]